MIKLGVKDWIEILIRYAMPQMLIRLLESTLIEKPSRPSSPCVTRLCSPYFLSWKGITCHTAHSIVCNSRGSPAVLFPEGAGGKHQLHFNSNVFGVFVIYSWRRYHDGLCFVGFECRCGGLYCSIHRYSDKHGCQFDYKVEGADYIRKNNPVVVRSKVQKL